MNLAAIRKLFGYDDKFFDLLEQSAIEAQASVQLLVQMLRHPEQGCTIEEFNQARRKDKRITEEVTEQLCRTFITPLEREDIEALSAALYKIPKIVEKFSEKYLLCREHVPAENFSRQVAIIEQSAETVTQMVKQLRSRSHLELLRERNARLQQLENEADKLMMALVKELYSGTHDPLRVIVVLDLYETLEKIIDRCRDAGNIIFQIVLKYS